MLLDVTPAVRDRLEPALRDSGFDVLSSDTIEDRILDADVVVVEADRGFRMLSGARALRGLLDSSYLVGVVGWWSEYEADLAHVADAMLHAPVREDDLRAVVGRICAGITPSRLPVLAGSH
jgi:hypothetical protein